jgi:LmbE family N-acetylglucosaminyl deacetylase
MAGLTVARSRVMRTLFVLHPILTAVFVVGTGNHYVADVVAGVALGLVCCLAAGLRFSGASEQALVVIPAPQRRFAVVSFHAHPDDEALIAGGTLARASADGHRVVVVSATLGEAGMTGEALDGRPLGSLRMAELEAAASALGCDRVEWLGYADSGRFGEAPAPDAFARADVEAAAARLADVLRREHADALTIYDSAGGYGHPDHVQVHRVGRRAAELAGTPLVLEATVDRRGALRLARILRRVPRLPAEFRPGEVRNAFTPHDRLTHKIDVRSQLSRKRAAMVAHRSQQTGTAGSRSLALYLRLPGPVFKMIFGHEWFVEVGRPPGAPLLDDVFATLQGVPLERRTASPSRADSMGVETGFSTVMPAFEAAVSQRSSQ